MSGSSGAPPVDARSGMQDGAWHIALSPAARPTVTYGDVEHARPQDEPAGLLTGPAGGKALPGSVGPRVYAVAGAGHLRESSA